VSSFDGSGVPDYRTPESSSRRRVLAGSVTFLLTGILIASAYFLWSSGVASSILKSAEPKMPVAEVTQGGVTVSILSADGQIHAKDNTLQIKFQDPGGHPVAAENVKVELDMNMPGMAMHSGAKIKNDGMGDYQADLTPDMAGDWSVDVSYQGPQGPAQLRVPVNVRQ
jgi:YtkA-like